MAALAEYVPVRMKPLKAVIITVDLSFAQKKCQYV